MVRVVIVEVTGKPCYRDFHILSVDVSPLPIGQFFYGFDYGFREWDATISGTGIGNIMNKPRAGVEGCRDNLYLLALLTRGKSRQTFP